MVSRVSWLTESAGRKNEAVLFPLFIPETIAQHHCGVDYCLFVRIGHRYGGVDYLYHVTSTYFLYLNMVMNELAFGDEVCLKEGMQS